MYVFWLRLGGEPAARLGAIAIAQNSFLFLARRKLRFGVPAKWDRQHKTRTHIHNHRWQQHEHEHSMKQQRQLNRNKTYTRNGRLCICVSVCVLYLYWCVITVFIHAFILAKSSTHTKKLLMMLATAIRLWRQYLFGGVWPSHPQYIFAIYVCVCRCGARSRSSVCPFSGRILVGFCWSLCAPNDCSSQSRLAVNVLLAFLPHTIPNPVSEMVVDCTRGGNGALHSSYYALLWPLLYIDDIILHIYVCTYLPIYIKTAYTAASSLRIIFFFSQGIICWL